MPDFERVQAQGVAEAQCGEETCRTEAALCPQAKVYVARIFAYHLRHLFTENAAGDRLDSANKLTRQCLGKEIESFQGIGAQLDAWKSFESQALAELDGKKEQEAQLAARVSAALNLHASDSALLKLAVYMVRNQEVRDALDLGGDFDAEVFASLCAEVLGTNVDETFESLCAQSPFRHLSSKEVLYERNAPSSYLLPPQKIRQLLRRRGTTADEVLACFFRLALEPRLSMADFSGMGEDIQWLHRYLRKVSASRKAGVNILLHGKPGTGKTELVRALARDLGLVLQEVVAVDDDGQPLSPTERLVSYCTAQEILRNHEETSLLFDGIEGVFPCVSGSRYRSWGHFAQMLETNPRPAFWVSNSIDQIEPAFLRRFDMVVEMKGPDRDTRHQVIQSMFKELHVPETSIAKLNSQREFELGHLERMADMLRTLAPGDSEESGKILEMLARQLRQALGIKPKNTATRSLLGYRPDCVNTDYDLTDVADALTRLPVARLCLYGPPGTGKTQWARQLADTLERPLLVRRGSDLLDRYVGGTEANIRDAFDQAETEGAVLLIDEADSFLQKREGARHSWEVAMVNEMLTAMENFEGIFVASTNLQSSLDPASARRFDFKVEFRPLSVKQASFMFGELCIHANLPVPDWNDAGLQEKLAGTTPGDFINVARQVRLNPSMRNYKSLMDLLSKELEFRNGASAKRRIGFL